MPPRRGRFSAVAAFASSRGCDWQYSGRFLAHRVIDEKEDQSADQ
jgi:hypothetical protein